MFATNVQNVTNIINVNQILAQALHKYVLKNVRMDIMVVISIADQINALTLRAVLMGWHAFITLARLCLKRNVILIMIVIIEIDV